MKSGRRIVLIIVGIVAVVCICSVVTLGRQYYNDRYVGSDYYAMVPLDYDMTPTMKYTDNKEEMGLAMIYQLTAYSDKGKAQEVEFSIFQEGSGWATAGPYIQPGSYLRVKASNQLVIGWDYIKREDIPAAALEAIVANSGS